MASAATAPEGAPVARAAAAAPRSRVLLNRDWTFSYGAPEHCLAPGYDDSDWFEIGLPHSFGTPYLMETTFYVGEGVYRRLLTLPDPLPEYVALEFLGVFQHCEVWVNGALVGSHHGGYTAFVVDLSGHVTPGDNLVAVRVANTWDARVAPRAGEHVFNGGIYRDVALLTGGPVRIDWYGTTIRAVPDGNGAARVDVETDLVNTLDRPVVATLRTAVDGAGPWQVVRPVDDAVLLPPGGTATVRQVVQVDAVRLWDVDDPHLYAVCQTLSVDDREVDRATTDFGVRTLDFSAAEGFSLNGRHLWLEGANVHQDRAGWSDAATHSAMRRDITLLRECGMNLIRGSHYPHHVEFVRECDRQGMLFWSELAFWGVGGESAEGFWNASAYPPDEADWEAFEQSCADQLRAMIRVHRNSPSVLAWSVGNEVFFCDDAVVGRAKALTTRLVELCHELDPTRPAAVGGAQRRGFDELGDLAGYNGDGAALFHDPGRPNLVSEYGSVIEDRPGAFESRYRDGTGTPLPWRSGVALWCAFHHGSIVAGMGAMGFVDYFRVPLRSYYWYRHHLRGIPAPDWPAPGTPGALRLTADGTRIRCDGTQDVQLLVELVDADGAVVSDERPVVVEVLDGDGLLPTGTSIVLEPAARSFVDGRGAVELRAYDAGPVRVRARAEGVSPAELVLLAEGDVPWSGRTRRVPTAVPSRRGLPRPAGARELSGIRPTACSSAAPGRQPFLVTEYSDPRGWLPAGPEPGAWVEVDLEGLWELREVRVRFAEGADVAVQVWARGETHDEFVLATGRTADAWWRVPVEGIRARSVGVRFPGAPVEVLEVHADGR